jgi:7,8-dihydroneopterin aldolase/epimerase/oxygenase
MDKIFLRQLAIPALIGIYDHEKIIPQVIFLDIEASVDAARAAVADNITATIDYAAIYHYLRDYITASRFQLLETLAVNVSDNLIKKFSLTWVRLVITKKPADLPDIAGAGVIIEREARS